MSKQGLRLTSIISFIVCAVLLFVALERCSTNASNVEALNESGFGSVFGEELEPATPTAAKYALFFAFLAAGAGVTCLILANKPGSNDQTPSDGSD
ncbi:MAG: hypothetical protein KTR15_15900 [Phycisphaeraceae bacterium]|nr:hypothetical protein [Phycisphaeraceae bacterium]